MMPNDSYTQSALADDSKFRSRVRSALSLVAWEIQAEDPATPNHANRDRYAQQVVRQLDTEVVVIMPSFVMRPNVFNFTTSFNYDFKTRIGFVESATGDADLQSQLMSDWDRMAAAAGFPPPSV
jgi:hypothetical protein